MAAHTHEHVRVTRHLLRKTGALLACLCSYGILVLQQNCSHQCPGAARCTLSGSRADLCNNLRGWKSSRCHFQRLQTVFIMGIAAEVPQTMENRACCRRAGLNLPGSGRFRRESRSEQGLAVISELTCAAGTEECTGWLPVMVTNPLSAVHAGMQRTFFKLSKGTKISLMIQRMRISSFPPPLCHHPSEKAFRKTDPAHAGTGAAGSSPRGFFSALHRAASGIRCNKHHSGRNLPPFRHYKNADVMSHRRAVWTVRERSASSERLSALQDIEISSKTIAHFPAA